jgi:TRAP transporter TAXI family solute receptor
MNTKYGKLYTTDVIKAGAYPGQDKDNQIAAVWNILVTNDKMSEDDAYQILKTIFDKKADLVAVHREAESIVLDKQTTANSPIPYHPGAVKYLKEHGVSM